MQDINIQVVAFDSEAYQKAVELRRQILRKPLGIDFTAEQLAADANDTHIVVEKAGQIIACLILSSTSVNKIKMRQVAVNNAFQGKGIGKEMVLYAENFAKLNGFTYICCNARETALPFYSSLNYLKEGDMFYEVSIPHFYMSKNLV